MFFGWKQKGHHFCANSNVEEVSDRPPPLGPSLWIWLLIGAGRLRSTAGTLPPGQRVSWRIIWCAEIFLMCLPWIPPPSFLCKCVFVTALFLLQLILANQEAETRRRHKNLWNELSCFTFLFIVLIFHCLYGFFYCSKPDCPFFVLLRWCERKTFSKRVTWSVVSQRLLLPSNS